MQGLIVFLCEGSALFLALTFLRVKLKNKIWISFGLGALGAVVCCALRLLHMSFPISGICIVLSLAAVFLFENMEEADWRYSWMLFFLTTGMAATLILAEKSFSVFLSRRMSLLFILFSCAAALYVSRKMTRWYPGQGFLDYFDEQKTAEYVRVSPVLPGAVFMAHAVLAVFCSWIHLPDGTATLVVSFLLFLLFWGTVCLVSILAEQCKMSSAMMSEKQYRAEMETFMNVIRSQRHDYNFHVQTIAGILRQNDLEACKKYVGELRQDSMEMNEVLPIHDPAISATIYNFRGLAAREGVKLHIDIQNDLSHVVTNVYETNKIISNLLQNALDEVGTHEDKSYGIRLYILKRGRYCVIHTINEISREMTAEGISHIYRRGYTTKSGHDGVGLSSIKSLAERNHGLLYTRMEDNLIHFVAKIPLRYETRDEDHYRYEGEEN